MIRLQHRISDPSRMVLGTAQLGMPYGIANKIGQPDIDSAIDIVETAWTGGIRQFDTAQGYGNSEIVLGKALHGLGISNQAKVISKLNPSLDYNDSSSVERSVYESLDNLKVPYLHGLMMHREEMIDHFEDGIIDTLYQLIDNGLINNIGISVYSPDKALQAMKYEAIKLVQLPANILDHRFQKRGVFDYAARYNKTIYIRSIFLQGLILLNTSEAPPKIPFAQSILEDLDLFCRKSMISRNKLAISYVKCKYPAAYVLFGAESAKQVHDNLISWKSTIGKELMNLVEEHYCNIGENILNPSRWDN